MRSLMRFIQLAMALVLPLGGAGYAAPRDVTIVAPDGSTEQGTKWALVIGCNEYDPTQVGKLKVAVADAKRMRDCLVNAAGFALAHVILLTDEGQQVGGELKPEVRPTYTTLRGRIAAFCQDHQSSDVLVIFFAGHGFHSKTERKDFLAPLDVQRNDLEGTAVPVERVLDWLRESGAKQSVLIADACRTVVGRASGDETAGVGDASLAAAQARGVWYLSSCRPGQISREDERIGGGLYTTYLVEALRGAADGVALHPKDGLITVPEAHAYVERKLEARTRADPPIQTPCRSQYDVSGGELVLSVPGSYPDPQALANAAYTHYLEREYEQAIVSATTAITLDPKNSHACAVRGAACSREREYDRALADLNRSIELNSKDDYAYTGRGTAWGEKREYDKALSDLTRAIELNPNNDDAYASRGAVYGLKGDDARALTDLNKALQLDPNNAVANRHRDRIRGGGRR